MIALSLNVSLASQFVATAAGIPRRLGKQRGSWERGSLGTRDRLEDQRVT
jgi:hypothetical protein